MTQKINISGVIVPNDLMWYYEFTGEDATCPRVVTDALNAATPADEIAIYINSPGGVIEAGSEIYTAIREADADHTINIYITGQACSAASVIACAAKCYMSPTALMMVHCVSTVAQGNHNDMEKTMEILETADRALCSAYVAKSGMTEEEALLMMEEETWLNAPQALERNLIDGYMFENSELEDGVELTNPETADARLVASAFELPTDEQLNQARAMLNKATQKLTNLKNSQFDEGEFEMNKEQFEKERAALIDAAEKLLKDHKAAEANEKMAEVAKMDDNWKAECEAQANLNALKDNQPVYNVQDLTDNSVMDYKVTVGEGVVLSGDERETSKEDAYKTDLYKTAWAKAMMNKNLTDRETDIMRLVNEDYSHTTDNTSVVVPETIADGIWDEIADLYPYWADIAKTYVPGKVTIIKSDESSDAAWYEESTATDDGTEIFARVELGGCELSRAITISWKLKDMAVADFIPYIQRKMAEKMGAGLGYGVTKGAGVVSGSAPEPKGIVTALTEGGDQVVSYTEGEMGYKDLTAARGLVKSGYTPAVYANSNTIWNVLANVCDQNGRPIFMADAMNGGVYRVLGCEVKEDASFADGEVLFSDAGRGYTANVNRDITVMTEEHVKARETDYCGYAVVDGAPITLKAHALLTVGE